MPEVMTADCFALSYAGQQGALARCIPALIAAQVGVSTHICSAMYGEILKPEDTQRKIDGVRALLVELNFDYRIAHSEISATALDQAAKRELPCVLFLSNATQRDIKCMPPLVANAIRLVVFNTATVGDDLLATTKEFLPHAKMARYAPHNVRTIVGEIKNIINGHATGRESEEIEPAFPLYGN